MLKHRAAIRFLHRTTKKVVSLFSSLRTKCGNLTSFVITSKAWQSIKIKIPSKISRLLFTSKKFLKRRSGTKLPLQILLAIFLFGLFLGFMALRQPSPLKAPVINTGNVTSNSLYYASNKAFSVKIGERNTNKPVIEYSLPEGNKISFSYRDIQGKQVVPESKDKTVTFKDVAPNIDLLYTTLPAGLKEEIVLKKQITSHIFTFNLNTTNAFPQSQTDSLFSSTFFDNKGNYLFHFEKPFAIDANGSRTDNVSIQIKKDIKTDSYFMTLDVDRIWLQSADRKYPISIDPTIVHDTTSEFATAQMNRVADVGAGTLATGGSISFSGGYTIHTFTSSDTFIPTTSTNVEVLVVAGGGSSTGYSGGGGGGVLYSAALPVTPQSYVVTVGNGGAAGGKNNGGNSSFSTLTAIGGGAGGQSGSVNGNNGGSGGGRYGANFGGVAGTGTVGPPRQGYDGGDGGDGTITYTSGGGGGGAGGVGQSVTNTGATGGIGVNYSSIFGTNVGASGWFGGGGAGYCNNPVQTGTASAGGGSTGGNGTANTGGGGGGTGGAGGSGIVIIRYPTSSGGSSPSLQSYFQETKIDSNTVGLWHFNETTGNALDSSGNGYTGTPTGTTIVDGLLGKARLLNGTSDKIVTSLDYSKTSTQPFTMSAWVNVSSLSDYRPIIGKSDANWEYNLEINTSGTVIFGYWNSAGSYGTFVNGTGAVATGSQNITINTWNHVAVVYNGSFGNIYVNGIPGPTFTMGGTLQDRTNTTTIGYTGYEWNTGLAKYFSGMIDDVSINNKAYSPEEIRLSASRRPYSTFTSDVLDLTNVFAWNPLKWTANGLATGDGETATLSAQSALVAQWNFNETSGATAVSGGSCGTSCNGTLTTFASTASQDQAAGTGWTAANRRWGAGALMFDGSDDYIVISSDSTLPSGTSDRSIEFWMNPKNTASGDRILSYGAWSANNAFDVIFFDTLGTLGVVTHTNNYQSTGKAILGQWNHVVITVNNQILKFYVNGILQSTHTTTLNTTLNNGEWRIGNQLVSRGANDTFSGILDSTRIYSRALTPSEIVANYNTSRLEFQTRVGATATPNDGTWETWKPFASELAIDSMDSADIPLACTATGGTTTDGGKTFTFTNGDRSTFFFTGADQQYIVPAGVTSLNIKLWGAGGGGGAPGGWTYGYAGGAGGYSTGTLTVTPGQVLNVLVGAGGHSGLAAASDNASSYGGGGASCITGGTDCQYGGQGGGRSSVSTQPDTFLATGGSITQSGGYRIHTFYKNDKFTANGAKNVEVLAVAGGGGGGSDMGGGGGGGGVIANSSFAVSAGVYNVTVGVGGAGSPGTYAATPVSGTNGGNSIFGSLTAVGGGGGGSGHRDDAPYVGGNAVIGGSGGGSATRYMYVGGQTLGAAGTAGQGTRGGNSPTVNNNYYAGGGGGAGNNTNVDAVNATRAGNGGDGYLSSILGTAYYFGAGGGGAAYSAGPAGNGGLGGGGGGSTWVAPSTAGAAGTGGISAGQAGTVSAVAGVKGGNGGTNTGSGGGGGNHQGPGGAGGSGIVIVRYLYSDDLITAAGGGGGGSTVTITNNMAGGGGGGVTGQVGWSDGFVGTGGGGGTQSAGGAAGTGTSSPASAGTKYQGGQSLANSYGGGGGGGWYGGGGGAYTNGNAMGGGGGGSSYTSGAGISGASTTAANGTTPGNSSDIDWGRSGTGGAASGTGEHGKVIISPIMNNSLSCTSNGSADVLIVAGGGGGGANMGGGGGGGGVIYKEAYPIVANTPISVTVGYGGSGAPAGYSYTTHPLIPGLNGGNSVFGTLTAIGGGRGGTSYNSLGRSINMGTAGGSGGGASGYNDNASAIGAVAGGAGTVGQGYAGGSQGNAYYSGGGGGAGGVGATGNNRANGGIGFYSDILGKGYYWGGGGGGAGYSIAGGDGGAGGAGGGAAGITTGGSGLNTGAPGGGSCIGCWTSRPGGDGGTNTGGGGGGSGHYFSTNKGGDGGSGIVVVRLSELTKDTTTIIEGTASQKISTTPVADINTVALWHLEETSGSSAYLKSSTTLPFATGGVISYSGGYTIHTFYEAGTLTVNGSGNVQALVVAGGGGGGSDMGGGGGGGGVIYNSSFAVTPTAYSITIGAGGAGAPAGIGQVRGTSGGNSVFSSLTAIGGGGGGSEYSTNTAPPASGGSGGGVAGCINNTPGAGTAGQGYAGGTTIGCYYPGGGGGAGGAGGTNPANGGNGYYSDILGKGYYWGAGGGGAGYSNIAGNGGMGGGGGGAPKVNGGGLAGIGGLGVAQDGTVGTLVSQTNVPGGAGAYSTGSGGGGGAHYNSNNAGGAGASGIVVVRYPTSNSPVTVTNNGTPIGTTLADGITGKARYFNGTSDYVSVADSPSLKTSGNAITIEAWVYPKNNCTGSGDGYQNIVTKNLAYYLNLDATCKPQFYWYNLSTPGYHVATNSLPLNMWSHIASVYDGTSVKIYINGMLDKVVSGITGIGTLNANTLDIGGHAANSRNFDGLIDEVKISNVARTPDEISQDYINGSNHRLRGTIAVTDLTSANKVPFYVASDRLGTFFQMIISESSYANYEPDANTVGLWHLDEQAGTGPYLFDFSGNRNSGTPVNTSYGQGIIGQARYFNGSNSYMTVPDSDSLDLTNNYTIEAWINPTVSGSSVYRTFLSKRNSSNITNYQVYLNNDAGANLGVLRFYNGVEYVSGFIPPVNKWTHIAVVVSGGTNLSFYANGVRVNSQTITASVANNGSFALGRNADMAGEYYYGFIDEVRLSNIARTADEIRQAYEVGSRTHNVTIDFKAKLGSGNLITGSGDLGFTVDETPYGATLAAGNLFLGDKIIVKENYDGTEYIAQGTVNAVNSSTGAVTVASWDTGSTFPSVGFTVNTTVFKWQREFFDITGSLASQRDAITKLTYRITDGSSGANIWIDDIKSTTGYLNTPTGSTITSALTNRYFQYRTIFTQNNLSAPSTALTSVTLDYTPNEAPNIPTLDFPTDTSIGAPLLAVLKTTAIDNNSDTIKYKINLCTDAVMTTDCKVIDQTASTTGWSAASYASGIQATYTIQAADILIVGTVYYWKTLAIDQSGSNTWSSTQTTPFSFTTNQAPNTPTLDTPINTAISQSLLTVLKTTATDNNSDVLKYKINLCTDSGMTTACKIFDQTSSTTGWSAASYASGIQATYTIQTADILSPNTTYYWKTYAIDQAGSNTWSTTQVTPYSFTTNQAPNTPTLDTPINTAISQSLLTVLKTTATDNNSDVLKYKINLCTDSGMTTACKIFDQTSSTTGWSAADYASGVQATYTIQAADILSPNTTYYWKTLAIDQTGSGTWSNTQAAPYSFTTDQAPNTPSLDSPTDASTGVTITPVLKTTTTDPESNTLKYKITLCTNTSMTSECKIFDQTVSATGWSAASYASGVQAVYTIQVGDILAPNTTYYWKSQAIDQSGSNSWSIAQTVPYSLTTVAGADAPSSCYVIRAIDNSYITVNWTDNATNEDNYQVWKVIDSSLPALLGGNLAANTIQLVDSAVSINHYYAYLIRALINDGSNTLYSNWCSTSGINLGSAAFSLEGFNLQGVKLD